MDKDEDGTSPYVGGCWMMIVTILKIFYIVIME